MMKHYFTLLFLGLAAGSLAQTSEDYIPRDAVTVFSINNFTLLQKIPMDELVKYEFMEEVQQELFDGSTSGKTLKDSGIDFDQKLNIYYGKGKNFEVSGFSFGIKDKNQLFTVFDDFDRVESPYPGVEFYSSYFNHLVIAGNVGILLRVDPNYELVGEITDSIWYARGNGYSWMNYQGAYDHEGDFEFNEAVPPPPPDSYDEEPAVVAPDNVFDEENVDAILEEDVEEDTLDFPVAESDPGQKNYSELRDSVSYALQQDFLDRICTELFVQGTNLKKADARFAKQLRHDSEGIFYLDNSRNFKKEQGLWYFQSMFPSLYGRIEELYTGNIILGDLKINESSIDLLFEANYGEALGSIYKKLTDAKFDKKILNYIPENSPAYFSYNVNLREAYEQAFDIIVPILKEEQNPRMASSVLTIELIDEFLNKDAVFDTYKGSMFGSFNGVKKVMVERINYSYDEETFEYTEETVTAEEEIPVFTFGFSTARNDIPEKILNYLRTVTRKITKEGDVWKIDKGFLDAVPLYIINQNGLFILTNDEDMVRNNASGYGAQKISKKKFKKARKGGFIYGYIDWGKAIERLPKEVFSEKQQSVVEKLKEDAGIMELTSSPTTTTQTKFALTYQFVGQYENTGKYILDLVNSLYILSR